MINDLVGKEIAGKYRVESLIRETELGDFYRGVNSETGVPVTIKILAPAMAIDQRYVDRFLVEVERMSYISHPAILSGLDFGTDAQGVPYAVYEFAEGETLRKTLPVGELTVSNSVSIAQQIAAALTVAHSKSIIHAGLNPDKVFVSDIDGNAIAKVFDFGVRRHARNSMTAAPFLAPEQCADDPSFDERSDIYSLGVLLFFAIAGEAPWSGATPAEIIRKKNAEPPPPLSAYREDLHPQIEPIILSAIAVDPEKRYQKMSDLAEDLARVAIETGAKVTQAADTAVAAAAAGTTKRNIWQTAFIALVGIVALAGALIYATSVRQTDPTTKLQPDANSLPVQPINPATGLQEEALAKLGELGDTSVVQNANMNPNALPGGDGFNAWANGGVPPAGAPLQGTTTGPLAGSQMPNSLPPGAVVPSGPTVTIPQNGGGSVFMPNEGGVILVPIPKNDEPAPKPTATPKNNATNTSVKQPGSTTKVPPTTKPTPTKTPAGKTDTGKKPTED